MQNNNNTYSNSYPSNYPLNRGVQGEKTIFGDEHKFFTSAEVDYFNSDFDGIIKHKDDGMPFINYDVAKKALEHVVGNNYDTEILSQEFISEYETYTVHLRIRLYRNNKSIFKDVIGSEKCSYKKDGTIFGFENLPKSAVKDGFKKFLSDYLGIGASQYAKARAQYASSKKSEYNSNKYGKSTYNNSTNTAANTNNSTLPTGTCSDCGCEIDKAVLYYSTNVHPQKRALCKNCQQKYK